VLATDDLTQSRPSRRAPRTVASIVWARVSEAVRSPFPILAYVVLRSGHGAGQSAGFEHAHDLHR